ncbi:MAG: hypothetical protein QXI60_06515 [Thermofilaceae archaeon]
MGNYVAAWMPIKLRDRGLGYRAAYVVNWLKWVGSRLVLRGDLSGDDARVRNRLRQLRRVFRSLSSWGVVLGGREYEVAVSGLRLGVRNVRLGNVLLSWVWALVGDSLVLGGRVDRGWVYRLVAYRFYPPFIRVRSGGGVELWSRVVGGSCYVDRLIGLGTDMVRSCVEVNPEEKLFWYNMLARDREALWSTVFVFGVGMGLWGAWGSKYDLVMGSRICDMVWDFGWWGELRVGELLWLGRLWSGGGRLLSFGVEVGRDREVRLFSAGKLRKLEELHRESSLFRLGWAKRFMRMTVSNWVGGHLGVFRWRGVYQVFLVPLRFNVIAPWELGVPGGVMGEGRRGVWYPWEGRPVPLVGQKLRYMVDVWFAPVYWLRFVLGQLELRDVPVPLWPLYFRHIERGRVPGGLEEYCSGVVGEAARSIAREVAAEVRVRLGEMNEAIGREVRRVLGLKGGSGGDGDWD